MQYSREEDLKKFSSLPIEWDLDPADAVTLYLEWGNNDWHAEHPPVRSKDDFAYYSAPAWKRSSGPSKACSCPRNP